MNTYLKRVAKTRPLQNLPGVETGSVGQGSPKRTENLIFFVGTLGLDSILLAEGRVLNLLLDPEVTYLTSRGGGGQPLT